MTRPTSQQQQAILARGNVLVMAGAGAGKTSTLVQRCLGWLFEDERRSLESILMVTFTEAAAREMRQRIRAELGRQLGADPARLRLVEQLALLDTVLISTLHSFCLRLVQQHFYELDLDPQVSVLPEEEAHLLAEEVLATILQRHYQGTSAEDEAVLQLIEMRARGWDYPIRQLVLRFHYYIQTLPNPAGWFEKQRELLQLDDPVHWRELFRRELGMWCGNWLQLLQEESADPIVLRCAQILENLARTAAETSSVELLRELIRFPAECRQQRKIPLIKLIGKLFEEAEFWESLCGSPTDDPLAQDWHWVRSSLSVLLDLTGEFAREFSRKKQELGRIDFQDLEQFTLKLLWDKDRAEPTPLAEFWRQKLELIFVDEYQDINAAQDAILTALAREGSKANRFLVGDVKQSIYRFRLAAPKIFQGYAKQWGDDPNQGQVIHLSENFRSKEAILDVVNSLFSRFMRPEIGGVNYDQHSWLIFGDREERSHLARLGAASPGLSSGETPLPHSLDSPVELHLRLTGSESSRTKNLEPEEDDENPENPQISHAEEAANDLEARLIGQRLIELKQEKPFLWDAETHACRSAQWSDMVILLRSPRFKAESFAKEFASLGVPLLASRGGFFRASEITDLISLLKILDNPLQDIPLLAVLHSPLVGLTVNELALVRLTLKGRFWTALQEFRRRSGQHKESIPSIPGNSAAAADLQAISEDARVKIELFLKRYWRWRRSTREKTIAACMEEILNDTQYMGWLLADTRGGQRKANLSKLLAWARQFRRPHRHGLLQFLKFIEAQEEAEIDHEPALLQTEDAVRLMSIHQSKGLEFPIVVVADLGKRFNFVDLKADIFIDELYGLCPMVRPPSTQQRYPSLPHWLAGRRQRAEALGEEMRLFYVAATRACQKLLLTGTAGQSAEERWSSPGASRFSRFQVAGARNLLDWVGPWFKQVIGGIAFSEQPTGVCPLFSWKIYGDGEPKPAPSPKDSPPAQNDSTDSEWSWPRWLELRRKLTWQYPHQLATVEPAKTTVSEFRRRLAEEAREYLEPDYPLKFGGRAVGSSPELSRADVGIAHHLFLQLVSLERVNSLEALSSEAARMEKLGILTAAEVKRLELPSVLAFWQSSVGLQILRHVPNVHRELPFTARLPWSILGEFGLRSVQPHADDEFIVFQGVLDLAVLLGEEIWILDFKTDQIKAEDVPERVKTYSPQLQLYSTAISGIYGKPVTRTWLHFLALQETVPCRPLEPPKGWDTLL